MFTKIDRRGLKCSTVLAKRLYSSFLQASPSSHAKRILRLRQIHSTSPLCSPRRRDFFSSNAVLQQQPSRNGEATEQQHQQARKSSRLPAGKTSLRRVAVEAQRSRDGILTTAKPAADERLKAKVRSHVISYWDTTDNVSWTDSDRVLRCGTVQPAACRPHP